LKFQNVKQDKICHNIGFLKLSSLKDNEEKVNFYSILFYSKNIFSVEFAMFKLIYLVGIFIPLCITVSVNAIRCLQGQSYSLNGRIITDNTRFSECLEDSFVCHRYDLNASAPEQFSKQTLS